MNDASRVERRRAARYDARLNLKVLIGPDGVEEEIDGLATVNVSASGLYFHAKNWIEPMTKLALSFDVPVDSEDATAIRPVECEGIVVRVMPEEPESHDDTYEVAVFFTTIDAESLHHLECYLENLLTA